MKKRESVDMVNDLRSRGKALLLVGLVILGSSVSVDRVKSEVREDSINEDYFSGFTFDRYNIDTFFDMTLEEAEMQVIPKEIFIARLVDVKRKIPMIFLCSKKSFKLIKDKQKNTKSAKELLKSGEGVIESDLLEYVGKIHLEGLAHYGNGKDVSFYYELVSNKLMAIGDEKDFYDALNRRFLDTYDFYTGDRNQMITSYKLSVLSMRGYMDKLVDAEYFTKKQLPYDLLEKEMTLTQFINDIYFKIVQPVYWPANILFGYQNNSIPNYSESLLEKSIDEISAGVGIILNVNDVVKKVVIYIYDSTSNCYYDFFTKKPLNLEPIMAGISIDTANYDFDESYAVMDGYDNQLPKEHLFIPILNNSTLEAILSNELLYINFWPYTFLTSNTADDNSVYKLVDTYRRLPLEYAIDYTGFDFSNNPDVINPEDSDE